MTRTPSSTPGGQPALCTPFAAILPFQQVASLAPEEFVGDFAAPESAGDPEKPLPLPEKKNTVSVYRADVSKCVCNLK